MKLPDDIKAQLKTAVFSLHGGQGKFDCWLTKIADTMADPNSEGVKPIPVIDALPQMAVDLMKNPHNVVDSLLNFVDKLQLFDYSFYDDGNTIAVTDLFSGHVIEVCPSAEENLKSIATKYGVENAIS